MEPAAVKQTAQQQKTQPSLAAKQSDDVKTLTTKAVVAYTEFLTSVAAAASPAPDAKRKPAEAIGDGVAKFEAAINDLREGVRSKRRKVDPVPPEAASKPAAAASAAAGTRTGQTIAEKNEAIRQQKDLHQALAAITTIVEKLRK
eukprot:COSAG02_NODE_17284_length_1015_cov_1.317686_2_plen_145_part_00